MNKSEMLSKFEKMLLELKTMPDIDGRDAIKRSIIYKIEFLQRAEYGYTNDLLYDDAVHLVDWIRGKVMRNGKTETSTEP